jgi:hypothetical protein
MSFGSGKVVNSLKFSNSLYENSVALSGSSGRGPNLRGAWRRLVLYIKAGDIVDDRNILSLSFCRIINEMHCQSGCFYDMINAAESGWEGIL